MTLERPRPIVKNADKVLAYSQKWNAAHKAQRRAIERDWRARNPEKVRDMSNRGGAKWSAGNGRDRRNALTRKRAAAKRQRTPVWADQAAIEAFYKEARRISQETGIPHEVDHIIPLQGETVSGLHVAQNLCIVTRSENRAKYNRPGGLVPSVAS